MARKKSKLVYGWGVNDVDYDVQKYKVLGGKSKRVWVCPYYVKWKEILRRCFCHKTQAIRQTYAGCTVSEDWKYFSNFKKWVDGQPNRYWMNCQPDKDILFKGNKHYSPETAVFVSKLVNSFITDSGKVRGEHMIGVCLCKNKSKPYYASCNNPFTGRGSYVGRYQTEIEAHKAWQAKKHEYACKLADMQEDERVAKALRERYAPDKDWTKS